MIWEISSVVRKQNHEQVVVSMEDILQNIVWSEYTLGDLFHIKPTKYTIEKQRYPKYERFGTTGFKCLNRQWCHGIFRYRSLNIGNTITCSDTTRGAERCFIKNGFYRLSTYPTFDTKIKPFNKYIAQMIISTCRLQLRKYDYGHKFTRDAMSETIIQLPTKNGFIDFDFIETYMTMMENVHIKDLEVYLIQRT